MNTNSNSYTFLFSLGMVVVVGALLAFAAVSTKERIAQNVKLEKMQNILSTVGVEVERDLSEGKYKEIVKNEIALKMDGTVDENTNAFNIDLAKEIKKPVEEQRFPLYIAENDGKKFYIIPLRGAGLWDAIWGYLSLSEDLNTITGAVFDHKGETPGLGAEITTDWFENQFKNEKIFNNSKELTGVAVVKGNNDPTGSRKEDNAVDAISGATITGDGVTKMIKERLSHYLIYIKNNSSSLALNQ